MSIDVKNPEYIELEDAVTSSKKFEEKAKGLFDLLHKDVDAKSWDIMAPRIEELIKHYSDKLKVESVYNGGVTHGIITPTQKTYMEFSNSKNWSDEMIKLYVPQIADPNKTRAIAGFLKALYMVHKNIEMPAEIREVLYGKTKALSEGTGASGGFTVPIEFRAELLRLIIEKQFVRPGAFIMQMANDTLWVPRIVDTAHASSIHGGIAPSFVGESADISSIEGDPTFGLVQLITKKFGDFKTVPNELIMDSPLAIVPLLGTLMKEAIGFFEDASAIWGYGTNAMLGFMRSGALISVTRGVTSHITYADVLGMQAALFPSSYSNAIWGCSPSALVDIGQLSVSVGTGGSGVYITNVAGQTAAQAMPMSLFGRPLIISEKFQTLGTAGDLVLIDPSYYIIGDRLSFTLAVSTERYFEKDQTAIRGVERLDGQPWITGTLTAYNGTDTLSAFVALS